MTTLPQPPLWQQNRSYSARLDRSIIGLLFSEGVADVVGGNLKATQNALGVDNSVDVAVGSGIVAGDDEAYQGHYLCRVEAVLNVPFAASPVANSRIDLLVLAVNDPIAGSIRTPANSAQLLIVVGVVAATPVVPAVPATAIPLAQVLRTVGDTFINNSMITDRRVQAPPTLPDKSVTSAMVASPTATTFTTSTTLIATQRNQKVIMNAAGATTITVNTSLFAAGDEVFIHNTAAGGTCTLTAGTATVVSAGPLAIPANGSGTLYFTSAGAAIYFPSAVTTTSSKVVQMVNFQTGAVATGTTIIPTDDTIPQITEGDQYMSLAITPTAASNILEIRVVWFGAHSDGTDVTVALFVGNHANALVAGIGARGANIANSIGFTHHMVASVTTALTFRVRAGQISAGTTTFNGAAGGRFFGAITKSSMTITEYTP